MRIDKSTLDFPSFYSAAKIHTANGDIYNHENYTGVVETDLDYIYPYIYPPTFAVLLTPITAIEYKNAERIWLFLNWLVFILMFYKLNKYGINYFKSKDYEIKQYYLFYIVYLLVSLYIYRYILLTGQLDLVLSYLLFLAITNYQNKYLSSLIIAITFMFKPIQIPILLYFILKKDYKYIIFLTLNVVIVLIITVLLGGFEIWVEYFEFLLNYNQSNEIEGLVGLELANNSLTSAIYRNISNTSVARFVSLTMAAIVVFLASSIVIRKKYPILIAIAPLFFIQPLFSSITWTQHIAILIPIIFTIGLLLNFKKYIHFFISGLLFISAFAWSKFSNLQGIGNNIYLIPAMSMLLLFIITIIVCNKITDEPS